MPTKTEELIAQKEQEIEQLRASAFAQDIIDVLQNKKHTRDELYRVCKAYTANFEKTFRQANLLRARQARKALAVTPTTV